MVYILPCTIVSPSLPLLYLGGGEKGWAQGPVEKLMLSLLADFGFANRYSLKNSLMSTFCGSVAYTAPEILMSKKYNGELADLWSL